MIFRKNNAIISASIVSMLMLHGCGGGSSSDNKGATSTAVPASGASSAATPSATGSPISLPDATSSPAATSSPTAASSPAPASSPIAIGEAQPSLSSPQAGSTAATGTGAQGIWTSTSGLNHTIAFIDPHNNVSSLYDFDGTASSELYSVISTTETSWTLTSGLDFSLQAFVFPVTSGSGTYIPKQSFTGTYFANGTPTNIAWNYDPANALSVTQQSVAGTWTEADSSLTIASDGSFVGTLSGCNVSGTLLLATGGSNQNFYTLTFSAALGASCEMPAGLVATGSAAIVFLPMAGTNGYARTIAFSAKVQTTRILALVN